MAACPGRWRGVAKRVCAALAPVANIVSGILIANRNYADLVPALVATVVLAVLIVVLEED